MAVNLTIKPFRFLLGTRDLTRNLVSLVLQWPKLDRGTSRAVSGSFSLAVCEGQRATDFYEYASVDWLPYQRQVRLEIETRLVFTGWVSQYRYNPLTGLGQGRLVDAIGFADFFQVQTVGQDEELPQEPPVLSISELVLQAAQKLSENRPWTLVSPPTLEGTIDVFYPTDRLLQVIQELPERDFFWLYVNNAGNLSWWKHPMAGGPAPRVYLDECEVILDVATEVTPFVYDRVRVTGARAQRGEIEARSGNFDEKGRPVEVVTTINLALGDIVGDFRSGRDFRTGGIEPTARFDSITTVRFEYDDDNGGIVSRKTTTVAQPLGWWFQDFRRGDDGPAGGIEPTAIFTTVQIETPGRIVQEIPLALVVGDARPNSFVGSPPVLVQSRLGGRNPRTIVTRIQEFDETGEIVRSRADGTVIVVEGESVPFPGVVKVPEIPVIEVLIEGEADVVLPPGASFFDRTLTINYSRLESREQANRIAEFWGRYELARQFTWFAEMEVPSAWSGQPFLYVVIDGTPFLTDDIELEISTTQMVFRAGLVPLSPESLLVIDPAPPVPPNPSAPFVERPDTTILTFDPYPSLRGFVTDISQARVGPILATPLVVESESRSQGAGDFALYADMVETSQGEAEIARVVSDVSQALADMGLVAGEDDRSQGVVNAIS